MRVDTRLLGPDERIFEQYLVFLRVGVVRPHGEAALRAILQALSEANTLGEAEKGRRLTMLLRELSADGRALLSAYRGLPTLTSGVKSAVASFLPPELRPYLSANQANLGADDTLSEFEQPPTEAAPSARIENVNAIPSERYSLGEEPVVALVGDLTELEASKSLLRGSSISNVEVSTVEDLLRLPPDRICSIIVASSCCNGLAAESQHKLLASVARINSQAWVKIGIAHLDDKYKVDLNKLRNSLGYTSDRSQNIEFAERAELTQKDIGFIAPAVHRFRSAERCALLLGGISERQALLVAFAIRRELERVGDGDPEAHTLSVSRASGGRSGAQILIVSASGYSRPIVLRLHTRLSLLDDKLGEFMRIKELIAPWNHELVPEVYYIGEDAALIYHTVQKIDSSGEAAITLGDRLSSLQKGELPWPPSDLPVVSDLAKAIGEAFSLLVSLNRQRSVSPINSWGYRYICDHLATMESETRAITIRHQSDVFSLSEAVGEAVAIAEPFEKLAVLHGDPHVSNILLPTDSHAELIDFEKAGVGHPLYDVCHFVISLAASSYRAYDPFDENVIAFREILFEGQAVADPDASASKVNGLVYYALSTAAQKAGELVSVYSLPPPSFAAMMVIVAAKVLMYLPHLQADVAKAIVAAARPFLKS